MLQGEGEPYTIKDLHPFQKLNGSKDNHSRKTEKVSTTKSYTSS